MMHRQRLCLGSTVLLIFVALAVPAEAALLIGWHSPDTTNGADDNAIRVNDNTPDTTSPYATGVLGTGQAFAGARGGREVRSSTNSTDGSYGSVAIPGAPVTSNAAYLRTASDDDRTLDVSITNTAMESLRLDTLHFDYASLFANSPKTLSVVLLADSDLENDGFQNVFKAENIPQASGRASDYIDADVSLATLMDNVLSPGETAVFRFTASDAATTFAGLAIDNIAFSGELIPEPASVVALALVGVAAMLDRRQRK